MLQKYQKALSPDSLLDVVPKEVLQSQMQGFFYGHKAGMVLMYDVGRDTSGDYILQRLEPMDVVDDDRQKERDWRVLLKNFNPFCAKFREDESRNQLCEACDLQHALHEFKQIRRSRRYRCHMGLVDITIPLLLGGEVRGVIFGGQKIIKDDSQMLPAIEGHVRSKITGEVLRSDLIRLARKEAIPSREVDGFEHEFAKFADTLQATIDQFYQRRLEEAERVTLLALRTDLGVIPVDDKDRWRKHVGTVLTQFCNIGGCSRAWLLQRRGSRFREVTRSNFSGLEVAFPVRLLIEIPLGQLHAISPPQAALADKLNIDTQTGITLLRMEASVAPGDDTSIAFICADVIDSRFARLLAGIAEAVIKPLGVFELLERIRNQEEDIRRNASFTGHHLKTPLQSVMFSLRNLVRSTTEPAVVPIVDRALLQLRVALADTIGLQEAVSPSIPERIETYELFASIKEDLAPQAAAKGLDIRLKTKTSAQLHVSAVRSELKIAFTNLLDNAIKYSFEGKWIDIRFSLAKFDGSNGRDKAIVSIEIEDVGVGFPADKKDKLFALGARLSQMTGAWEREGFGIGLVQAREYIENARGSLDIDSESESGSQRHKVTVSILLPYIP
jgi:signal transduction histidine kinase